MCDGFLVKRELLFALAVSACAPRAMTISGDHPANPDAAPGRTAGPPPALRPGVATLEDPPPSPTLDHEPDPPEPGPPAENDPDADRAKVHTIEDTPKEPDRVDPEKVHPQKVEPIKDTRPAAKPTPKQPPSKKPAAKPSEPARSTAPVEPPTGHEGHQGHGGHP